MNDPAPPVRRSDLPTRALAGVVMIGVALAAVWMGGLALAALVGLAAFLMILEWAGITGVPRTAAVAAGAALPVVLLAGGAGAEAFMAAAIVGLALLGGLVTRRAGFAGGLLYVGLPSAALLALAQDDRAWILWMFVVTWATDILAYFAGRSIGGPKLAPAISPNKTWSGLFGGMIGAAVFGAITASLAGLSPVWMWLGGPMGLVAQLGDLFESHVKRRAGVKDSGHILPGHGGVLDRLDGLLAVAAVTAVLVFSGLAP